MTRSWRALAALLVVLLLAALCDVPGPTQEPWHTLLFGLTLGIGGVLAVRAAAGQTLRFAPIRLVWLLFGQFFGTRVSFPFARFDMFTAPAAAEQTHYLYRAQHASGAERAFEPGNPQCCARFRRWARGTQ